MLKDLNKKKDTEIAEMLTEKQEGLRKLRFEKISGAMKNPNVIGELRKDIARIKTEIRARGLK